MNRTTDCLCHDGGRVLPDKLIYTMCSRCSLLPARRNIDELDKDEVDVELRNVEHTITVVCRILSHFYRFPTAS